MTGDLPAVLARGGTSRGLIFRDTDLAGLSEAERELLFARAVGSPDPGGRQVDGVGGGTATTSKVAVVGRPHRDDADVRYDFYQIDVTTGRAELRGTCGNLTAAVAQFAVDEGLIPVVDGVTEVRMHNTNIDRIVVARVPVADGRAARTGDHALAGVPGTGAPVDVRFRSPAGGVLGDLFPLGASLSTFDVDGRPVDLTVVDVVNPLVLIDASGLGIPADITPAALEADSSAMARLESLRARVAAEVGLATSAESARTDSPTVPFVGICGPAAPYRTLGGEEVASADVSLLVRMLSTGSAHRALPLGAGLAAAAAARLPGTVAARAVGERPAGHTVRLGHPSGILEVTVRTSEHEPPTVDEVGVVLTARRIMTGWLCR